jgi:predicted nucleic acid-binding protein
MRVLGRESCRRPLCSAAHGVDALQIATALIAGCAALLANDTRLQRVTELRVLVLDELEL